MLGYGRDAFCPPTTAPAEAGRASAHAAARSRAIRRTQLPTQGSALSCALDVELSVRRRRVAGQVDGAQLHIERLRLRRADRQRVAAAAETDRPREDDRTRAPYGHRDGRDLRHRVLQRPGAVLA